MDALISEKNISLLSLKEAAEIFEVTTATIRNWNKLKLLKIINTPTGFFFNKNEIDKLKNKIETGKIDKLNKRANKINSSSLFIPSEYFNNPVEILLIEKIIKYINDNKLNNFFALFVLTLNYLYNKKVLRTNKLQQIFEFNFDKDYTKKNIFEEIKNWFFVEKFIVNDVELYCELMRFQLPEEGDVLGGLYQSLKIESEKSKNGSFYTPSEIVENIVKVYCKKNFKVLDPCCGTGQFLIKFADVVSNPEDIFGFDIDITALRIARINLMLKFLDVEFIPNIIEKNTIFDVNNNISKFPAFDLIATNPPWGCKFSKKELILLKKYFPEIKSEESFSYIIQKSIDLLNDNGVISFILPESILNVKTHCDIRKYILEKKKKKKYFFFKKFFKKFFRLLFLFI